MERHPVPHLLDPPPRCTPAGQGLVHASDSAGPSIDGASPHSTSARNEGQPLRLGRRAWLASDFMARVQEIRQASDRVALADSRIAASLPARDSEPGRSAWEAACADFHEEFARFVALVGLDEKLIRRGEPSAIERAITFMEADPQCFRSGYMLANAAYALANAPLSDDDRARLRIIVIDQVERPRARMMRPTGRLAGCGSLVRRSRCQPAAARGRTGGPGSTLNHVAPMGPQESHRGSRRVHPSGCSPATTHGGRGRRLTAPIQPACPRWRVRPRASKQSRTHLGSRLRDR